MTARHVRPALHLLATAAFLAFLTSGHAAPGAAAGPSLRKVGLIDGFQGAYDNNMLIDHLRKSGVLFQRMGPAWTPLDRFLPRLSALVVSGDPWVRRPEAWPEALTPRETADLKAWIEGGGHLLFINTGANLLREKGTRAFPEWLGFTTMSFRRARGSAGPGPDGKPVQPGAPNVLLPETRHPFLAHLGGVPGRLWMGSGYVTSNRTAGKALIALDKPDHALLHIHQIGKGQVVHFGRQAFRYIKSPKTAAQKKANELALADMQGVLQAVADGWPGLLRAADVLRAAERAIPCRERLFAWYREPGTAAGPAQFPDPAPRAAEQVTALEFDIGRDEFESFFLYLTNFGPARPVAITVSDLTGPDGLRMDRAGVLVRVQAPIAVPAPRPAPQMRGKDRAIWLHRLTQLPPDGAHVFTCAEFAQVPVWVTVSPQDAPAGEYRGTLAVTVQGRRAMEIPLRVRAHPVRVPHERVSFFNNINSVTLLPGAPARGSEADLARYRSYLKLIRDYSGDIAEIIGPAYPRHRMPEVVGTGLMLPEAVRKRPEMFRGKELPALDFSWFTPSLKPVADAGFRGLLARGGFGPPFGEEDLRAVYEKPGLTWRSVEGERLLRWYFSEWTRFIRGLGFDCQRLRMFDEIDEKGEKATREYLWFQSLAQAAGFKTGSTFQFYSSTKAERIRRLNPATSCWMVQAAWTLAFREASNGLRDIEPTDEILAYGWRWEKPNYYTAHEEFWRVFHPIADARQRVGFYYAGLLRPAHFATVAEHRDGFIVAASMESYRDALDAVKLYRGLRLAKDRLPPARWKKLEARLEAIAGFEQNALIRFSRGTTDRRHREYESLNIPVLRTDTGVTVQRYRKAKRRLLELSAEFLPAATD